jgi:FtsP/CotA-like multicopper oxidase with cupredoxin domain
MRYTTLSCICLPILLSLCGCRGSGGVEISRFPGEELRQPAGIEDINSDPAIVEVNLSAAPLIVEFSPGVSSEVWAYNGSLPGPLIEANQGDRIIVHFTNNLPEATTIHWHGVRLSNENDGTHLTQEPVEPGGSFTYDFIVPDASLFWYHPHHGSAQQVYQGLYGPLLVHGDDPLPEASERVLVLSDIVLDAGHVVLPWSDGDQQMENAMGYLGNTQLVNGQIMPRLEVKSGGLERWRIVNASGARFFNLQIPGQVLTMVGTDGGLIESPVEFDSFLLSSGERVDLLIATDGEEGDSPVLKNAVYRSMHADGFMDDPDFALLQLRFRGKVSGLDRSIPAQLATIEEPAVNAGEFGLFFNAAMDPRPDQYLTGEVAADAPVIAADFRINGQHFPDVVAHQSRLGTVEQWQITNHTLMDHPFHLHGYRFLVDNVSGSSLPYRGWKDTVNVPGSLFGNETVQLIVPFEDNAGSWVYHCHILRHVELGMMGELVVTP